MPNVVSETVNPSPAAPAGKFSFVDGFNSVWTGLVTSGVISAMIAFLSTLDLAHTPGWPAYLATAVLIALQTGLRLYQDAHRT